MTDPSRTNNELIEENSTLKRRIRELEQSESKRKRVEEALRESEKNYRSLFQNAPIGIFHSLPEGRYLERQPYVGSNNGVCVTGRNDFIHNKHQYPNLC